MTPQPDPDELKRWHRHFGAAIAEDEDRQVFEAELARIPNKVNLR